MSYAGADPWRTCFHLYMESEAGFVYSEYNVGDSIAAYTTDHVSYSYYKYGILPDTEYTNNELMKVAGVLLGIGIFLLALFGVLSKKMNYKK